MHGEVTGASVVRAMTEVYSDERWQHDFDVIWDLSSATELLFDWKDYEEWLGLHQDLAEHVGKGNYVVLVSTDSHEAIIKTYAQFARTSPRRRVFVFRSRDDAEKTLELRQNSPATKKQVI
jgi:hypothetical protein